jgi:hypothetical protein
MRDHNRSFLYNFAPISGLVVRGLTSDDSVFGIRNAKRKRIINNSRPYGRPKQAFKRDNITFGSLLILTIRILMPKIHGWIWNEQTSTSSVENKTTHEKRISGFRSLTVYSH